MKDGILEKEGKTIYEIMDLYPSIQVSNRKLPQPELQ